MEGGLTLAQRDELLELLVELEDRPLDYVLTMFPWGEPGTELENRALEPWQTQLLTDLQSVLLTGSYLTREGKDRVIRGAILAAVASGKNVGKSCLVSLIIWWAFSTKPKTKGRATANTEKQLTSVLWTELHKWHRLFAAGELFSMTATRIYSNDPKYRGEWHFDAMPWSEDNPDAWAGLHNQGGRVLMVFDEASGIADSIWERADGATREANTQVIWLATSNPTKTGGRFFECFHRFASLWMTYKVDSREVSLTDHVALEEAIRLWGLEDDYTKMSILGEFPSASFTQLIPLEAITRARAAPALSSYYEPLILGVDPARMGNNESVATFRRGRDARTIPTERRRGITIPECADWVGNLIRTHNPDAVFVDMGGLGAGVVDLLKLTGFSVIGVNFGSPPGGAPGGIHVLNKRAEMYVLTRDWLREGAAIWDSDDLETQLISIDYTVKEGAKNTPIKLMSKEDMARIGKPSPDLADALALTFAYPVSGLLSRSTPTVKVDYDPLGFGALPGEATPTRPAFNPRPWEAPIRRTSYDPFGGLQ